MAVERTFAIIKPDAVGRDLTAELRVVAERQPHDAGAVAVVRNPRRAFGNREPATPAEAPR